MLFFLQSCATKRDKEFVDLDTGKVEETLEIDQVKFDKFIVKKKNKEEQSFSDSERRSEEKKRSENKVEKEVPKKSQPNKELKKSKVPKKVLPLIKKKVAKQAKDYPKEFLNYDKVSREVWAEHKPKVYVGEKFTFKVGYLGLTVGHIQMETLPNAEINGREVYHFKARMRSARYYSYIYTLDDSLESFVTTDSFLPLKYVLLQRESGQKVDDLQLFDQEELKTYFFYKRLKEGKKTKREEEKPIPSFFQDSFSALHFVRGLPLKLGETYKFPIVTRGKIWILEMKPERIEEISANGEVFKAIRVNAETRFPGVLEKKGDILFWYSADEERKLLKFEADVKIGSVSGELVEYIPSH